MGVLYRRRVPYERLVEVASQIDHRTYVIARLGEEAGLLRGEIIALECGRSECIRVSGSQRHFWNGGSPREEVEWLERLNWR